MRRLYKLLLILGFLDLAFLSGLYLLFSSIRLVFVICLLELIAVIALLYMNWMIKKTDWFKSLFADYNHEIYPDNIWYRKNTERNYDLVNLGSNPAKYAFDYSEVNIKAMNWSSGTQTLIDDFRLLKNFHSILKKNGAIIVTIMPFTSINKETGFKDTFKFYTTLDSVLLDTRFSNLCVRYYRFPILFGKEALKAFVKRIIGKDKDKKENNLVDYNPLSKEQLIQDAERWIACWKKEFGIEDLNAPLTKENQDGRNIRIKIMRNIIDFAIERDYKVVWVIPPVTNYLGYYFSEKFKDIYIYDYLKQVDREVPILDYMDDFRFEDVDLYFNSFFLNKKGAGKFTEQVLKDMTERGII